jgi:hypothetical protein
MFATGKQTVKFPVSNTTVGQKMAVGAVALAIGSTVVAKQEASLPTSKVSAEAPENGVANPEVSSSGVELKGYKVRHEEITEWSPALRKEWRGLLQKHALDQASAEELSRFNYLQQLRRRLDSYPGVEEALRQRKVLLRLAAVKKALDDLVQGFEDEEDKT